MENLEHIKRKLVVELATSLSDTEINRCLGNTVLSHKLIPLAKHYRDNNILRYSDISNRVETHKKTF